jgi:branched-chain amino acid transport system substrate-binding protein
VFSKKMTKLLVVVAVTVVGAAACSSSSKSSSGSSGSTTGSASAITVGVETDQTGSLASDFKDIPGIVEARIDAQNAQGGINGHHINVVVADSNSSAQGEQLAAHILDQTHHVSAMFGTSGLFFVAAPILQKAGIPVFGVALDGPEWGQQPYSNMFSVTAPGTEYNGSYYNYDAALGQFLKSVGVTKLAYLGYNLPSIITTTKEDIAALKSYGVQPCYVNTNVPLGGVDFTADALAVKNAGCNGVVGVLIESSAFALSGELKNAGYTGRQLLLAGYASSAFQSPESLAETTGDYFEVTTGTDLVNPSAAATTMLDTIHQYDPSYTASIPEANEIWAYQATDLMIQALQQAGSNPTRASIISAGRKIASFNAGGLIPFSLTYQNFASPSMLPNSECMYFVQLKGNAFVNVNGGKPFCAPRQAYTP